MQVDTFLRIQISCLFHYDRKILALLSICLRMAWTYWNFKACPTNHPLPTPLIKPKPSLNHHLLLYLCLQVTIKERKRGLDFQLFWSNFSERTWLWMILSRSQEPFHSSGRSGPVSQSSDSHKNHCTNLVVSYSYLKTTTNHHQNHQAITTLHFVTPQGVNLYLHLLDSTSNLRRSLGPSHFVLDPSVFLADRNAFHLLGASHLLRWSGEMRRRMSTSLNFDPELNQTTIRILRQCLDGLCQVEGPSLHFVTLLCLLPFPHTSHRHV